MPLARYMAVAIRSLRYRCGGDKMHKPYRSLPCTSPIALLMAWRVLNAMVYHRKSAARESLSTDPLQVRATLKDMTRFLCSLTLKLVFLHFRGPALLNLPKSISDFTQHQAPLLSLQNKTFNETTFR
jgi:hypothetical protein